jgi:hypothetical protein
VVGGPSQPVPAPGAPPKPDLLQKFHARAQESGFCTIPAEGKGGDPTPSVAPEQPSKLPEKGVQGASAEDITVRSQTQGTLALLKDAEESSLSASERRLTMASSPLALVQGGIGRPGPAITSLLTPQASLTADAPKPASWLLDHPQVTLAVDRSRASTTPIEQESLVASRNPSPGRQEVAACGVSADPANPNFCPLPECTKDAALGSELEPGELPIAKDPKPPQASSENLEWDGGFGLGSEVPATPLSPPWAALTREGLEMSPDVGAYGRPAERQAAAPQLQETEAYGGEWWNGSGKGGDLMLHQGLQTALVRRPGASI